MLQPALSLRCERDPHERTLIPLVLLLPCVHPFGPSSHQLLPPDPLRTRACFLEHAVNVELDVPPPLGWPCARRAAFDWSSSVSGLVPVRARTTMAANRERQVGHIAGFPTAVYPFPFNSIRSHSSFDLLANGSLFGRFGTDLPKEMAALCK
ncbi:hypothetical protein AGOR_G00131650 [Albula goreensis]|uniref:Uncharacterized protein n=1 Tax=Albula goreensis TaxID=1534307 RepID=A0A8T3D3U1_9TELE|nr:hypothetical protein AGOR_G00131650 [Albula goreensis]